MESLYILYDGKCAMCNGLIRILDRHSNNSRVKFHVTRNSRVVKEYSKTSLALEEIEELRAGTILAISSSGVTFIKSDAIARILFATGSNKMILVSKIIRLMPKFLADLVYDIIAKVRKRILFDTRCYLGKMNNIHNIENGD